MVDAFRVEGSSLRDDSDTWDTWRATLLEIAESLPMVGESGLHPLSFSRVRRGQDVRRAYESRSRALLAYLTEGADQAERTARKLTEVARIYAEAESENRADIARY